MKRDTETPPDSDTATQPADAWLKVCPRLRDDLVFVPRSVAGRPGYVVEDPLRGKFLRFGIREYVFAAACDGKTSIQHAKELSDRQCSGAKLSDDDVWALVQWLSAEQLFENSSQDAKRLLDLAALHDSRQQPFWKNPICIRLPLLHPDRLIGRILPYLGWIVAPPMIWTTLVATLISTLLVWFYLGDFKESLQGVFTTRGQLQLLVVWTGLKVIHELAHGLACKRYGGEVREAGMILLLFLPLAYVDVTSSWRIQSRWRRIHVAAAGMLVELFVAAVAAIVWFTAPSAEIQQTAANVVLMASLTTVVFNANPLMRFDGYYIVTDLLNIPNLYNLGIAWTRYVARTCLCGIKTTRPLGLSGGLALLVPCYAILSAGWRILVYLGIIIAAAMMWKGAGLVLASFAAFSWFAMPIYRAVRFAIWGEAGQRPLRLRVLGAASCFAMLLIAFWTVVPWPFSPRAAATVHFAHETTLRAEADAFVEAVCVSSGETVKQGDRLIVLRNDDLQFDLARLQAEVARSKISVRSLRQQRKLAALNVEEQQLEASRRQLAELEQMQQKLTVTSPIDGVVISSKTQSLVGSYVRVGQDMLVLGDPRQKQLEIRVAQSNLQQLGGADIRQISGVAASGFRVSGRITQIDPRATSELPDQALAVIYGGPLSVAEHTVPAADGKSVSRQLRLLEPHFRAIAVLSGAASGELKAGQTVVVYYGGPRQTVGQRMWTTCQKWFAAKIGRS